MSPTNKDKGTYMNNANSTNSKSNNGFVNLSNPLVHPTIAQFMTTISGQHFAALTRGGSTLHLPLTTENISSAN